MNKMSDPSNLHFILVPLLAQGHMIPMVDMAHLLADRGVRVSLITTPVNASRIRPVIDRANSLNLPIHFIELEFPCAEFGLPNGCENADLITSRDHFRPFVNALYALSEPLENYLQTLDSIPNCIISDMCNAWTGPIARRFEIPRLVFHGPSCFYILACYNIFRFRVYDSVSNDFDSVLLPDFPVKLEVNKAQSPGFFGVSAFEELRRKILEEELKVDGVVINSFDELEHPFINHYERVMEKRVWAIGSMCLYNKDADMRATRGKKPVIDPSQVLTWLDQKETKSVLYVNFGSFMSSRPVQFIEIGNGLEASNQPFIWVIKEREIDSQVEKWLCEGFEERTKDRGLIIRGWAPQMVILSHPSIGGFMTHCGWNSVIESISAGVPMVTWPHCADQFLNENLVVEVLKIGIKIGVTIPITHLGVVNCVIKSDDVKKAVSTLMDEGEERMRRRERVKDFAAKAKQAMEEQGSSFGNLTDLISFVSRRVCEKESL